MKIIRRLADRLKRRTATERANADDRDAARDYWKREVDAERERRGEPERDRRK